MFSLFHFPVTLAIWFPELWHEYLLSYVFKICSEDSDPATLEPSPGPLFISCPSWDSCIFLKFVNEPQTWSQNARISFWRPEQQIDSGELNPPRLHFQYIFSIFLYITLLLSIRTIAIYEATLKIINHSASNFQYYCNSVMPFQFLKKCRSWDSKTRSNSPVSRS